MKATRIVYWPGQRTAACDDHAAKLQNLAELMGFNLSSTPAIDEEECGNCRNEEAKKAKAGQ